MNIFIIVWLLFAVFFIAIVAIAVKKEKNIYANGIETDSVVVRVEHYFNRDHDSRYRCYVRYIGDDFLDHEGLLNVRTDLPVGRKVRIKYLSGKYDSVVFISQEIE